MPEIDTNTNKCRVCIQFRGSASVLQACLAGTTFYDFMKLSSPPIAI